MPQTAKIIIPTAGTNLSTRGLPSKTLYDLHNTKKLNDYYIYKNIVIKNKHDILGTTRFISQTPKGNIRPHFLDRLPEHKTDNITF
jgi:hypothetical protein